jgi:hypothetical protein
LNVPGKVASDASVSSDIAACPHWPTEEATGTSYANRNSLFSARGMRGQAFPFYTDCIIIVRWKRRPNMLLMSTTAWIVIGVAVVILAVVIGVRIKQRYF